MAVVISGSCDSRFEAVRDAFAQNFADHEEAGASVALSVDGRLVVDLWGGVADAAGRPWERDTIVCVYSSTKGMGALCLHILADRGLIDLEAPVATYWPEFAQAGKERILVRWVLSHQAALPAVDDDLPPGAALDWAYMIQALERQRPLWEPGTNFGYHAVTFGWLVGELVRRVSGQTPGAFLRDSVAAPLGADFLLGVPPADDDRVATMRYPAGLRSPIDTDSAPYNAPGSISTRAVTVLLCPPVNADVNSREWRATENFATNGHASARGMARIYGALGCGGAVDGVRLLSESALVRARQTQVQMRDEMVVVKRPTPYRVGLGFMLSQPELGDARGPNAFGSPGAGGSLGFADPDARLGFGYAMNQMWHVTPERPDLRATRLVQAVYRCI